MIMSRIACKLVSRSSQENQCLRCCARISPYQEHLLGPSVRVFDVQVSAMLVTPYFYLSTCKASPSSTRRSVAVRLYSLPSFSLEVGYRAPTLLAEALSSQVHTRNEVDVSLCAG